MRGFLGCLALIGLVLLFSCVSALVVGLAIWGLWTIIAVGIFGLQALSYWVCVAIAFCLSFIASLFKSNVNVRRD